MRATISIVIIFFHFSIVTGQIPALKVGSDKANELFSKNIKSSFYPVKYVDPMIGTGGHGHTFPGSCAPFGMIQLSPDTRFDGWDGCSGYHYSDSILFGFSHTHLSGTGVSDYGDLLILPQVGKPSKKPKYLDPISGYGYKFSHDDEIASPGFYSVNLKEVNIKVRLTTGLRSGMHEYSLPNDNSSKSFIIDLEHRDKLLDSELKLIGDSVIEGFRVSSAWAKEQHFYFSIRSSTPIKKIKKLGKNRYVFFIERKCKKAYLHVGISSTDVKGARLNRWSEDYAREETFESKFIRLLSKSMHLWHDELSKIQIETNQKKIRTNFYTSLYHSMIAPNLISDVDGRYRGIDNNIHQLQNDDHQFTVFSLWDTYRATHPLYTIIDTNRTSEFIRTFLRIYNQSGNLPVWELNANETNCMIGYHSASVITDAFVKGITGFDANVALEAMIETSSKNEFGKKEFHSNQFISSQNEPESVSKTLEYAYDDFCISEFAKLLKQDSIARYFQRNSYNFTNLFDPSTGFMRARKGAQWFSPFAPEEVNFNYTEANSWQYSLYAPQHIGHLINLLGGKDSLENWLDNLFNCTLLPSGRAQADITGLIGQYAHGNEPSHHMAYLYNYTNSPFKTQLYVDSILQNLYNPIPNGLSGNEDCGQMSSWYVLSALGIYPITPGVPIYQIGRPLVDFAELKLENGNSFKINVRNNSKNNKFIQSIQLNDSSVFSPILHHRDILNGCNLVIEMGPLPCKKFLPAPLKDEIVKDFVATPFIVTEDNIFSDSLLIELSCIDSASNVRLLYKIDDKEFHEYKKPFIIRKTSNITIKSIKYINDYSIESASTNSYFVKKNQNKALQLKTKYANQYSASGENSLIDEVYGGSDFRTGNWQGFYGEDIVAEISFNELKKIKTLGVSCLKDLKSWIFFPHSISIFGSNDGINYNKISRIKIKDAKESDQNNELKKFIFKAEKNIQYKHFRFVITNPGKCPKWHLGAGNKTWVFLDEIILE